MVRSLVRSVPPTLPSKITLYPHRTSTHITKQIAPHCSDRAVKERLKHLRTIAKTGFDPNSPAMLAFREGVNASRPVKAYKVLAHDQSKAQAASAASGDDSTNTDVTTPNNTPTGTPKKVSKSLHPLHNLHTLHIRSPSLQLPPFLHLKNPHGRISTANQLTPSSPHRIPENKQPPTPSTTNA